MRKGGADAAAVAVNDVFVVAQWKDDALIESIGTLRVEQADMPQQIEGVTLCRKIMAQTPARGIADFEFLDECEIVQSALVEVAHCFRVTIHLLLIEGGSQFEHCGRIGCSGLWIEAGEALMER